MSPGGSSNSMATTSGTPGSKDLQFYDYPLDRVMSYLTPAEEEEGESGAQSGQQDNNRQKRAYSVGSRPENLNNKINRWVINSLVPICKWKYWNILYRMSQKSLNKNSHSLKSYGRCSETSRTYCILFVKTIFLLASCSHVHSDACLTMWSLRSTLRKIWASVFITS